MMMHLLRGLVGNIRNATAIGVVTGLNDAGAAQTVNVTTSDGVERAGVEVAWPWGFSANAPADGMITVVLELGADAANMMALPPMNPSARFGGLQVGGAVIYASDGSRVKVKPGGVEIWGANVTIKGNVQVTGDLTVTGNVSDGHGSLDRLRGHYDGHVHGTSPGTSEPDAE